MKIKCIDRHWHSNDPVICEMLSMDCAKSLLTRQREPSRYGDMENTCKEHLQAALATDLHSSVDCRGLHERNLVPHHHRWVAEATGQVRSANYIRSVKVRGNLLLLAVHVARGHPHTSVGSPVLWDTSCRCVPGIVT